MDIQEKANSYAEGKAKEAITKAIAQAYIDGYKDGYKSGQENKKPNVMMRNLLTLACRAGLYGHLII